MSTPAQRKYNRHDLVDVHPAPPPKTLPERPVSLCCFPSPRKASKSLPVLDPRYSTFEALAASGSNPKPPPSPRTQRAPFDDFERGSTGSYSRFPKPIFSNDDRARYAREDFYPSGACREQAGWHPHGQGNVEASAPAVGEGKGKRERTITLHNDSFAEPEPTSEVLESDQSPKLPHHQSGNYLMPASEPQRIVTDHFLSFSSTAEDDNGPTALPDIRPPTNPLPLPSLPLRSSTRTKPAVPSLPHRYRRKGLP